MRIVAGRHRGRVIAAPEGQDVRPTGERARQALFNILEHGKFAVAGSPYHGRDVLDCFAGTGALGLEALSRGAAHASFIEQAAPARAALRANIQTLGEAARSTIVSADAVDPPKSGRAHALALLDPPYGMALGERALARLAERGWLQPDALIVLETGARETLDLPAGFTVEADRTYGVARLTFIRWSPR